MTIDTQEQAQAEARKRWGLDVFAEELEARVWQRFCVGIKNGANKWITKGRGDSWDAAFADADRKQTL